MPSCQLLFRFDRPVGLFKLLNEAVDHVYKLAVFRAPLVFGNILQLLQHLGIHAQGIPAFIVLHFVISRTALTKF